MTNAVKTYFRKISALFRNEINAFLFDNEINTLLRDEISALFCKKISASTLEEICEAASPNLRSYLNFLSKHSSGIMHSYPASRYEKLYAQNPSESYQEIRNMIRQYGNEKTSKLFEVTFHHCAQNATRLIKKYGLENNIILNERESILIKNLDITGNIILEFNQFTQVSFIRNIFRDDADIKITNPTVAQGFFVKNQARENLNIRFYNTSRITSIRNKYLAKVIFNYQPRAFGLKYNPTPHFPTTINFTCNKIFDLSITDHIEEENFDKKSMPIRHIGFFQGNSIEQLRLQTVSNKMFDESLSTPSADIESIFFDSREDIGASHKGESLFFSFAETFFRKLKKQAIESENHLLESTYKRQEKMLFLYRLHLNEDRFILAWSEFASYTGTSWIRPLFLLLSFQFTLAVITYVMFAGYDLNLGKMCTPDIEKCHPYFDTSPTSFLGLLAWFINPVSLLPPVKITMTSWLIYVIFLLQKLFSAVFYYEIIKALRRFSR